MQGVSSDRERDNGIRGKLLGVFEMRFNSRVIIFTLLTLLFSPAMVIAADPVLGWLDSTPDSFEGYTLMSPGSSTTTYLLDNSGREVHSWQSNYRPGLSVYLLDEGKLLRSGKVPVTPADMNSGGWGGLFQVLDWDSNVLWQFQYSDDQVQQHHDVEMLPNGNVLVLAWEMKSAAEAILPGPIEAKLAARKKNMIGITPAFPRQPRTARCATFSRVPLTCA